MKLEDKIYGAIGLTVFLTIAYYYVYSFVELHMSKLCDKYVCFEFPPYADFLAIWVAIIGLYFIVTSLDDWKKQYKFNNTIEAIKDINIFKKNLVHYIKNLNSILDIKEDQSSKSTLESIKKKYNKLSIEARIIDSFNELEKSILIEKVILPEHEKDIKKILTLLDKVIRSISHQIISIKQEENDTSFNYLKLKINKMYEKEVLSIIKLHSDYLKIVQTGINNISIKLNNFIE